MVDAVMRAEQWRRVYGEVEAGLAAGAEAVLVVTPYLDDESPVYVGRGPDGAVSAVTESPIEPPCVTGGVYGLGPAARRAAAEAVAAGVRRMRGFLKAFVAAGRRVVAVEVDCIIDVDRPSDLGLANAWLAAERGTIESGPKVPP
jgi:hypothetical protein